MFKNYLLVAIRNLRRNRLFSLINIFGLSIGLSSALIVYLIVHFQFGFDRFEPGSDRIYRVVTNSVYQGNAIVTRGVPAPLGEAIRKELPGVEDVATFRLWQVQKTAVPDHQASVLTSFKAQTGVVFANDSYFHLLPYRWLAGEPPARRSTQRTGSCSVKAGRSFTFLIQAIRQSSAGPFSTTTRSV